MKKIDLKDGQKVCVWITKYALTSGIVPAAKAEVCIHQEGEPFVKGTEVGAGFFHGDDWHLTEIEAYARVSKMIQAKRKSIQKTLQKLEVLEKTLKERKGS